MRVSFTADAGSHLPTPEGWECELAEAEKKITQTFKFRQSEGSNWGPCGWKTEILPIAPTVLSHFLMRCSVFKNNEVPEISNIQEDKQN